EAPRPARAAGRRHPRAGTSTRRLAAHRPHRPRAGRPRQRGRRRPPGLRPAPGAAAGVGDGGGARHRHRHRHHDGAVRALPRRHRAVLRGAAAGAVRLPLGLHRRRRGRAGDGGRPHRPRARPARRRGADPAVPARVPRGLPGPAHPVRAQRRGVRGGGSRAPGRRRPALGRPRAAGRDQRPRPRRGRGPPDHPPDRAAEQQEGL
ncbi:MAG: FIG01269488: protein, clustered with ribosomal protein L32p, partial [uncultured Quadrisphaera sp.]